MSELPIARLPSWNVEILYEVGPCLAVCKPGGLLTQAPPGIDSMETRLKSYLKLREQKSGNIYLAVIHRLDRPVSGVLLFARNVRAARRLAAQFQQRQVRKIYWALLEGCVEPPQGQWHDTMRKVPDEARAELVPASHPDAQQASLSYRVLGQWESYCWLEIELLTGRMHQIRLQAASRGHPILGDTLYGATQPFGPVCHDWRARWIALHARQLEFVHPMTRQPVVVTAPLAACWPQQVLESQHCPAMRKDSDQP